MRRLIILAAMTAFGATGWWLGGQNGLWTAFIMSTVASGVGLFLGRRFVDQYLP